MRQKKSSFSVVCTTLAKRTDAFKMANAILQARLAACAQITRIHSVYHWQAKIHSAPEYLLQFKTHVALVPELMKFIKKHHPYQVPEIVALPMKAIDTDYANWIVAETKPRKAKNEIKC